MFSLRAVLLLSTLVESQGIEAVRVLTQLGLQLAVLPRVCMRCVSVHTTLTSDENNMDAPNTHVESAALSASLHESGLHGSENREQDPYVVAVCGLGVAMTVLLNTMVSVCVCVYVHSLRLALTVRCAPGV